MNFLDIRKQLNIQSVNSSNWMFDNLTDNQMLEYTTAKLLFPNDPAFVLADTYTSGVEGLLSNVPNDSGGLTWCGIAYNKHPEFTMWDLIKSTYKQSGSLRTAGQILITNLDLRKAVIRFYYDEFWVKTHCCDIAKVDPMLGVILFDSDVNCGPGNGGKFLQTALNMLNVNGTLYPDISVDGGVGSTTIKITGKCAVDDESKQMLYNCLCGERYTFYRNNSQHEQFRGWFKRVF